MYPVTNSTFRNIEIMCTQFFAVIPEVQLTTEQARVLSGSRVSLNCIVLRGNPSTYTFSWSFNGATITGFTVSSSSSSYVIESVIMSNVGVYSCRADNGVGEGVATINITLGGKRY